MSLLVLLPVLIPAFTAACCLLVWRSPRWQRRLGLVGAAALFVTAVTLLVTVRRDGIQTAEVGNWPAPFGIVFVADLFGAIMTLLAGIIGLAVAVYSLAEIDPDREAFGYYPLYHVLLMGVCGAFLTGDIFNLYVWFEVLLMGSFVLLALGGERGQLEGALKYFTLNMMSSVFFLTAIGVLYGSFGALNMAELAGRLDASENSGLVLTLAMLFMVAFGIKAAAFPLFFWLPASYHLPPSPISAVFAGLLTKVGVYAQVRVFSLLFVQDTAFTHRLILIIAGLTMITGVLGAVAQNDFRRILSFHIVSQIGYMLMGLGLFTPLALAGTVFYIVHHIVAKAALFLSSGLARRLGGSYELKELGGLYRTAPAAAALFAVPALALAGIPPFSGFFAKLVLIKAGLETEQYLIVGVALLVSLLTLFSMTKIWSEAFWKPAPHPAPPVGDARTVRLMMAPLAALATLSVAIGLLAGPVSELALETANQLMDRDAYITAVLGPREEP